MRHRFPKARLIKLTALLFCFLYLAWVYCSLPSYINVGQGDEFGLYKGDTSAPVAITLKNVEHGKGEAEVSLFGIIPMKTIGVNKIENGYLIPGGDLIGVKMNTNGVLVVEMSDVQTAQGLKRPAKEYGLRINDIILAVNGERVRDNTHFTQLIQQAGDKQLELTLMRDGLQLKLKCRTELSSEDGQRRLGIWVRDSAAGLGTMTYIDPNSSTFGALGHAITDVDTSTVLNASEGSIHGAQAAKIQKGKKGEPGEMQGVIKENAEIGGIIKNTEFGIFGYVNKEFLDKTINRKPMKAAMRYEIKEGDACILFDSDGSGAKQYKVKILRVSKAVTTDGKGLIIKITDSDLIEKTGGIIQGMSGSPIIQGDKIVGAVTHVFVNEPHKGYGIFIENMLENSNSIG